MDSKLAEDTLKVVGGGLVGSFLTFILTNISELKRRRRQERQALGTVSLLILEWSELKGLYNDRPPVEFQREEWRLLVKIAESILPITSRKYLALTSAVSRFVILTEFRTATEAMGLFERLTAASNPALRKEYERLRSISSVPSLPQP